jgi:hypothetical protein
MRLPRISRRTHRPLTYAAAQQSRSGGHRGSGTEEAPPVVPAGLLSHGSGHALARPRKSMAYWTMPFCGRAWPTPWTLTPSTGALTVLVP